MEAQTSAAAAGDIGLDPRNVITPEAFRVSAELLGVPLAKPWQRAAALAVDGLCVTMLAHAVDAVLALVACVALYIALVRGRRSKIGLGRRLGAIAIAVAAFSLVYLGVHPLWDRLLGAGDERAGHAAESQPAISGEELGWRGGAALAAGAIALNTCADAACRQSALQALESELRETDLPAGERRALLLDLVGDLQIPAAERDTLQALVSMPADEPEAPAPAATPETAAPAPAVAPEPAGLRRFGGDLLAALRSFLAAMGLGLGWGAAYFTVLPVWWQGRTIGKRLFGLRVVHLSGQPLGYWACFSRYGGYAAGLAMGLLGFLQVFWDANRQAVQDKIAFTAVVRMSAGAGPRIAAAEAAAG